VNALAYDLTGPPDAPVIMFGSSLGTTRAMWQPQLDALAGEFRVLRFDHLGHGESAEPAGPYELAQLGEHVVGLLDQLELPSVGYAGVSLGGMVGMWLAANHPDRVTRLALLCTSAHLPPEPWHERAKTVRAEGTAGITDTVVSRWFTPAFAAEHPQLIERFKAMLRAAPREGYASCCEAIAGMDLRPVLGRITAPTLVVSAADDLSIPAVHGQAIAEAIPGSTFTVLPDAAHIASAQHPETVNELLRSHFAAAA
jgi:3-oxoadipate enol-lactonase